MSQYKVGDRVERFQGDENDGMHINDRGVIINMDGGYTDIKVDNTNIISKGNAPENVRLIETNNTNNMSIISKTLLAFKSEPEKTFIKAGILNNDGSPTADGISLVVMQLLKDEAFASKFSSEIAQPIVAENEKKD